MIALPRRTITPRRRLSAAAATAVLVASALAFSPPAAAQTQPFPDVSEGTYYSEPVARLADNGIFDGTECAQGMFCPGEPIDRKTMAVWTVRALDGADPAQVSQTRFTDVSSDGFHAPFIERMAELGVTTGCGDRTAFCPDRIVTRAQMAVFLTRAFNLDPGPDPGFTDVAADAWYYNQAAALAASGITVGCGDGTTFCPSQNTTRAQMATFLARALGLVDQPTTPAYKDVEVGFLAGCGLRTDNTIACWGWRWSYVWSEVEGEVQGEVQVEAGGPDGAYEAFFASYGNRFCGVGTDSTITCWSVGVGQDGPSSAYVEVLADEDLNGAVANARQGDFRSVTIGGFNRGGNACAIGGDGTVTCWSWPDWAPASAPSGTFEAVTVGRSEIFPACGLRTDSTITCWNPSNDEVLADPPRGTFKALDHGFGVDFMCAIRTDDTVTCWDFGWENEVPIAARTDTPEGTFTAITSGPGHACGIRTDGTITCWGSDRFSYPKADPPVGTFTAIDAGGFGEGEGGFTCAVSTDGTISCWGGRVSYH